jgi:hypothetical protein
MRKWQTCKGYSLSKEYSLVRYKSLWKKSGYPQRKRFPRHLRTEANLLQANRWPRLSKQSTWAHLCSEWDRIPGSIDVNGAKVKLSKAARLIGEYIYDVSVERDALFCFELQFDEDGKDRLSDPIKIQSRGPILSYDVDRDEGVLVVLEDSKDGFRLTVYDHAHRELDILQEGVIHKRSPQYSFTDVSINRSSVMVSIDNDVRVFDWKKEEKMLEVWSRKYDDVLWDGLYVRGQLLSSQVVACIALSTYRTIGSMRVRHGIVELYRLDQQFPRVADITLPEAVIDILQPRVMQDPYRYISLDLGGKRTMDLYLRDGIDGPTLLQVFSDTVSEAERESRILSSLFDSKAAGKPIYTLRYTLPKGCSRIVLL